MVSAALGSSVDETLLTVNMSGTAEDRLVPTIRGDQSTISRQQRTEILDRLDQECRVVRECGYNPATGELIRLALELERRGHTLFLEGAAAGSTLFYVAGLTPINPSEHGLLSERFVATSSNAGSRQFESSDDAPFDFMSAQVSMSRSDLLTLLRQRGYGLGVETDTIPGYPTRTITAAMQGTHAAGPTIRLAIETTELAVLSNSLGSVSPDSLEQDCQAWNLLASGNTDGIEPLESPAAQIALRTQKPRSLLALAEVLVASRGNAFDVAEEPVIYQEDLMALVHDRLGTGLRTAWSLITILARPESSQRPEARKWFFGESGGKAAQNDGLEQLWALLSEQAPGAVCKAHYLALAFHCLRAAYLKSHYPGDFRGVLAAMRSSQCLYHSSTSKKSSPTRR
jgi:DNA polymerase III alpha subunit